MEITTNNYELVHSGTIIQIENSPINIVLPDKNEGDYTITFEFITDPNEKSITRLTIQNKFHMKIEFINFNHVYNIGNTEPLHLGTLNYQDLYLIYRVNDLRALSKTIHYNFYVKRRDGNE